MDLNSSNPFLAEANDFLSTDHVLDHVDYIQQPHLSSTSVPLPRYHHGCGQNTGSTVVIQSTLPEKLIKKFNGYLHEDAQRFLADFASYLLLANIEILSGRAVAAFHLHLQGPALVWFNALPSTSKLSWPPIENLFRAEYCDTLNSPALIAEEAAYNNLNLNSSQPIEEFHSVVLEKGRKLGKSEQAMISKFVAGLPHQLAFFVRAGRIQTFRDALHMAKTGEAHGYRAENATASAATPSVNTPSVNIQAELLKITQRLNDMDTAQRQRTQQPRTVQADMDNTASRPGDQRRRPPVSGVQYNKRFTCYHCSGEGHAKSRCQWTGRGPKTPDIQCQLCFLNGHAAKFCKLFQQSDRSRTVNIDICQLCDSTSHVAGQCPQLNREGLTVPRSSQTQNHVPHP